MSSTNLSWKKALLFFACFAVVCLFARLGFWQLSRAQEKLEIKTNVEEKVQQVLALNDHKITMNDRFSGVRVTGRYLSDKTFFLDRKLLNGVPAYAVVTPFLRLEENTSLILVNRGLVPATSDRGVLPKIQTPEGELEILGNLNYPSPQPAFWRDSFPIEKNSIWQYTDIPILEEQLGNQIAPLVIELDKNLDHAGGYVRQWRAYDDQWVNRHRAYALQWFSMAVVFVIMCFLAFRSRD